MILVCSVGYEASDILCWVGTRTFGRVLNTVHCLRAKIGGTGYLVDKGSELRSGRVSLLLLLLTMEHLLEEVAELGRDEGGQDGEQETIRGWTRH